MASEPQVKDDKTTSPPSKKGKGASGDGDGHKKSKKVAFDPSKFSVAAVSSASADAPDLSVEEAAPAEGRTPVALGNMLEEAGLVNHEMIQELVASGNESAQSLKRSLIQQGIVSEEDILDATAESLGMERRTLRDLEVTPELLELVDPKFAKRHRVFPVEDRGEDVVLAVSDPTNIDACDQLQVTLGRKVTPVLVPETEIDRYITKFYEGDEISRIIEEFTPDNDELLGSTIAKYETIDMEEQERDEPPPVRFVSLIFKHAVHEGASDIHIEPTRTGLSIRFRIDGVLQEIVSPPATWKNHIISRLKVLSGMDLAEKRVPQDGRIKLTMPDKKLDLRVSALPSIFGETIVMRILDQSDVLMGLGDVGFLPDSVEKFERLIKSPNGVILMTGPTGSGKTTTLNAALSTLNTPERKIITVEDPVEYQVQGINQIQVNREAEVTFALALRSMLRMSPDVIMVGEIRDLETAEIAIRAALTGHLVFSTLHTNDAPSATIRLIDMGVKPFLVASSIQAVIAQRLVRRICSNCKHEIHVPPEGIAEVGVDPNDYVGRHFYAGAGCDRCNNTGYRGRTAIHEIFEMTPALRKLVIRSESNMRVKRQALDEGMRTLRMDGWEKVLLGQTTIEEIMARTQMD